MTKSSAVQHQDSTDGAKDADECIWLLPASDLELSMLVSTPMEARKAAFF
jgi:hypothetical protein